jgi:hypothetical protein
MSKRWSLIRSLRYEIYEREQFAPPLYVFYQNDSANLKVNGRGPPDATSVADAWEG